VLNRVSLSVLVDLVSCGTDNLRFVGTVNLNVPTADNPNAVLNAIALVRLLIASEVRLNSLVMLLLPNILRFGAEDKPNSLLMLVVAVLFLCPSTLVVNALDMVLLPVLVLRPVALTVNARSKCASALSYG